MDAPLIVNHPSTHFASRGGYAPVAIVIHHTAGVNSLDYLTKNANQVSTHVLIREETRDGKQGAVLYRMVGDALAANAVGYSNLGLFVRLPKLQYPQKKGSANQVTLNIELENLGNGKDPYSPAQVSACGWQIAQWWNQFGDLPVISHQIIDTRGKNDPHGVSMVDLYRAALQWYDA